jgi:hypothetical protein
LVKKYNLLETVIGNLGKHPLHARTREDVENHLRQLGGILHHAHPKGGSAILQGQARAAVHRPCQVLGLEAVRMLMQVSKETEKEELHEVDAGLSRVQTVRGNYEGFTQ